MSILDQMISLAISTDIKIYADRSIRLKRLNSKFFAFLFRTNQFFSWLNKSMKSLCCVKQNSVQSNKKLAYPYSNKSLVRSQDSIERIPQFIKTKGAADATRFSHLTVLVHVVVRQFHLLEGNNLFSQLFASKRRVRMRVKSRGCRRICFAGYQPAATMISISVSLVVERHDVHQHRIMTLSLESTKGYPTGRKHPSTERYA